MRHQFTVSISGASEGLHELKLLRLELSRAQEAFVA
jgi:hypothetical protein